MTTITVDNITAYQSLPELCFRLIHDGATVLALFESDGFTWTKESLVCATTEKECLNEIARLGLKYTPAQDISTISK